MTKQNIYNGDGGRYYLCAYCLRGNKAGVDCNCVPAQLELMTAQRDELAVTLQKMVFLAADVPTWVHDDAYQAQVDMRVRIVKALDTYAREALAMVAGLEAQPPTML